MENIIIYLKKYGVTGLMAGAVFWLNMRLNTVEDRLYKCYDQQIDDVRRSDTSTLTKTLQLVAILPKEESIHEIKKTS